MIFIDAERSLDQMTRVAQINGRRSYWSALLRCLIALEDGTFLWANEPMTREQVLARIKAEGLGR